MTDTVLTRFDQYQPTTLDQRGLGSEEQPDWGVVMTFTPDTAGILDTSNWEVLQECLAVANPSGDDYDVHSFAHWATRFELLIVRPGTPAYAEAVRCVDSLANYPILCDQDYSRRECEAQSEAVSEACRGLSVTDDRGEDLTADAHEALEQRIFEALYEAGHLKCSDEGCWVSDEQMSEAMTSLGYTYNDTERQWHTATAEIVWVLRRVADTAACAVQFWTDKDSSYMYERDMHAIRDYDYTPVCIASAILYSWPDVAMSIWRDFKNPPGVPQDAMPEDILARLVWCHVTGDAHCPFDFFPPDGTTLEDLCAHVLGDSGSLARLDAAAAAESDTDSWAAMRSLLGE